MAAMTSAQQKSLLDHALNIAVYTPPTSLYLSLHTGSPTASGSHANEVTTSASGYARQLVTGKMGATDSSTGKSTLSTTITTDAALIDWGTISYIGIDNSSSATASDTMRFYGAATTAQTITVGERFQAVAGQFAIRFS